MVEIKEIEKIAKKLTEAGYPRQVVLFITTLKLQDIKKLSLLELSTRFLNMYPKDTTVSIKQLFCATIEAGIEVTDCAWSNKDKE